MNEIERKDRDIMSEINEFNTPASDSIEALFHRIEDVLDLNEISGITELEATLAALWKRVTDLEAERNDFHRLATAANDWFGTTAVNDHERIMRWQKEFDSLNKRP